MKEYINIVFMNVHLYLLLKEDIIPSNCSIYLLYSFLLRNKRKGVFYTLNSEQKLDYIERSLSKDHAFRNLLVGMIVGHFTLEEYPVYKTSTSALNKRMMTMAIERLKDQAQSFAAL